MNHPCRYFLTLAALACLGVTAARGDDWPQWLGPQRDSVWRETGLLEKFPEGGPKVLWRAKVEGGYAGPAVAEGRVFVTDFIPADNTPSDPNKQSEHKGTERILCFNATDGKPVWKYEYPCVYKISYPAGPRATPTVHEGKVYTVGAMGNLYCLEAATGKELWSKDFQKDYNLKVPIWGCCSHPLIDGQKLFCVVGGAGSVAVAFDKDSGKELWRALSAKEPGYSAPTLITAGGTKQLLIWHAESLNSLDPESGKVYWSVPLAPQFGMAIMVPRKYGDYLFAAGNGTKAVLLKLTADKPGVEEVWRGKNDMALYPINGEPFIEDGYIYGADQPGQFRCVKLETGERVWESLLPTTGGKRGPTGTAFVVKNGDRFILMSETGHLILAKLSPKGYEEISRAKILEPTNTAFGRSVVWSHPAFANKCVFARNDKELICVSLAAEPEKK